MGVAEHDASASRSSSGDDEGPTRPVDVEPASFDESAESGRAGQTLGRYVLLRPLGAGGMSVVWLAYDPQLDRRVALKLMHPGGHRPTIGSGEQRLLREAQALARLSHANVVHVYDVGVVDGQVYLAMELIEGVTLKEWLSAEPRRWRESVGVLAQAAAGLAAAHAAGLVHLDFKPSNVIVADDGVVRVVDFGLAREPRRTGDRSRDEPVPSVTSSGRLTEQLTEVGSVLGTPGYIAPELLGGGQADARADQFSFCVTLWEALYRERPFAGDDRATLHRNVIRGRVRDPPTDADVPGSVRRLLVKGLSVRPEDRHSGMDELRLALRARLRRRRPIGLAAAATGLVVGAAAWSAWPSAPEDPCATAGVEIEGTWNPGRAARARAAFEATAMPYANDVFTSVERVLAAFDTGWSNVATAACEATHVRGEQPPEVLALQHGCLERARGELDALVELFESADAGVVEHALEAAIGLPDVSRCLDVAALRAEALAPLDAAGRVEVADIDGVVARARALSDTGRLREAAELSDDALARARVLGHAPTFARTARIAASVQASIGQTRRAEQLLDEALWAAESSGLDRLRMNILADQAYVVGHLNRNAERGQWYAETAMRVEQRVGAGDEERMQLIVNRGVLASERADHAEALRLFEDALELHERIDGPEENRSTILGNLGSVHYERGEFELALNYYDRALALDTMNLGASHPRVANTLTNSANAEQALGHFEKALDLHRRALAVYERAGAARGPALALGLNNVGVVLSGMQRWEEAASYYERARETLEVDAPDHPILDVVLLNLAETSLYRGRAEQALSEYERALERLRRTLGNRHPYVAAALSGVGIAELELDRPERARPHLEEALAIHDELGGDAVQIAETRTALARVLAGEGGASNDRRALQLALTARDALATAGDRAKPALARAEAVIAALR